MKVKDPAAVLRWRKRRHLSQRQLAYLCHCSQTTIYLVETGKMPTLSEELALRIAFRLDVDWEELFELREVLLMPAVSIAVDLTARTESVA